MLLKKSLQIGGAVLLLITQISSAFAEDMSIVTIKPLDESFYVSLKDENGKTIEFGEVTLTQLGVSALEDGTYTWDNATVEQAVLSAMELSSGTDAHFEWTDGVLSLVPEVPGYGFDADTLMYLILEEPGEAYYKIPANEHAVLTENDLEPLAAQVETLLQEGWTVNVNESLSYQFPMQLKDINFITLEDGSLALTLNDPYMNYVLSTLEWLLAQQSSGNQIVLTDRVATQNSIYESVESGGVSSEASTEFYTVGPNPEMLIGSSVSTLITSSWSRQYNVNRGTQILNGIIVMPGESFSFVDHIGAFNSYNGWVLGYSIINGAIVSDYGGGICQVSTQLYRALLDAGITPDEQHEHSTYYWSYYGDMPGLDATIFTGGPDLRFTNPFNYPIYIEMYMVGATAYVNLYGDNGGLQTELQGPYTASNQPQEVTDVFGWLGYNQIVWKYLVYDANGAFLRQEWLFASYDNWVPQY